ncbi:hypothetical protein AB0C15_09565 [Micromonospora sp. NPDC048835]|uniref:hypothetical protein n=1 Tax=Micromonospora sp. NPDC048835 TaxID=3155147 RepID=UPI003411C62E
MWNRDLDVLVPMWQGADDTRVRQGAAALGALVGVGITEYVPQLKHDQQTLIKVLSALNLGKTPPL